MIRVSNLTKRFGAQTVLDAVSCAADPGEVLGLIGPNGAGKSTLLKAMLGVVRPTSGGIEIAGADAVRNPLTARQRASYAPGEIALYDSMRGGDFLEFSLGFWPDIDTDTRDRLLSAFALPLRKRIHDYSHGMKRKLLLVQAIAPLTPVLLLDEPMSGLDPSARLFVQKRLAEQAAAGRTILYSAHDLTSIERVCHRVLFLREGRVAAEGLLAELLADSGHEQFDDFYLSLYANANGLGESC